MFEKAYPGIKVENVDATADTLVARAISESRGGKTLGDDRTATDSLVDEQRAPVGSAGRSGRQGLPRRPRGTLGRVRPAVPDHRVAVTAAIPAGENPPSTFEDPPSEVEGQAAASRDGLQILQARGAQYHRRRRPKNLCGIAETE